MNKKKPVVVPKRPSTRCETAYEHLLQAEKLFSEALHETGEDELIEGHKVYARRILLRLSECGILYHCEDPPGEPKAAKAFKEVVCPEHGTSVTNDHNGDMFFCCGKNISEGVVK